MEEKNKTQQKNLMKSDAKKKERAQALSIWFVGLKKVIPNNGANQQIKENLLLLLIGA